jgi:hypothetical protein
MIVYIFADTFHFLMKLKWFPSNLVIIAQHEFGAYLGFLDNRIDLSNQITVILYEMKGDTCGQSQLPQLFPSLSFKYAKM